MPPVGYADPSQTTDPDSTWTPKILLGHTIRSSLSSSHEPSRQVTLAQPLRSRRPRTGSTLHVHACRALDRPPSFMTKAAASRGTVFLLEKNDKLLAPDWTCGRAQQIQSTPE
jgi:hypothetical protein